MCQKIYLLVLLSLAFVLQAEEVTLYKTRFDSTPLGRMPEGWREIGVPRSTPKWGVDGKGFLRTVWKGGNEIILYDGIYSNGVAAAAFTDGTITADFQKTSDHGVSFGLAGRIGDARNFYAVRFSGLNDLSLIKSVDGVEQTLATLVTLNRYQEGQIWRISLALKGSLLTGRVMDVKGVEQARVDALDENGFSSGSVGIQCSNFSAAREFSVSSFESSPRKPATGHLKELSASDLPGTIVAPIFETERLNTPFNQVSDAYDVVVAGAGTGGWSAALQACRLGAKVLLVEESDWIGGQMAAAAVTSMDESGVWNKFPVRERGIYREFHQSIVNFYYTLNKDPFRAYYAWPEQIEGGYEPKVVKAVLYGFIADARKKGTFDLLIGTSIKEVRKDGPKVTGVLLEKQGETRPVRCGVLVEATEYGDILPLAGARYRVGTVTSDSVEPNSPVQSHTWVAVIREYHEGLPEHLRIKSPPPGYDARRYRKSQLYGRLIWGAEGKDYKGPRVYRVLLAWRGMADMDSPMTGLASQQRHTQCGLNGGRQDYPVTAGGIEDPKTRIAQQVDGIYRALNEIYYLQHELGLPWSVADDEGFNTGYQQETMARRNLRSDLLPIALHLPQVPYVRECRRGIGIYTLRTSDMGRFENARLFSTSVAMGDYFMDIDHGRTGEALEMDLDPGKPTREGGPVQVPFEVFIPEKIDGIVLAEKNISQSRIVNGATRLQPVTILTGQAAGTIAAVAAREKTSPRNVNPIKVQVLLLKAGSNLIQRWYEDVSWGSSLWQATQLLSLYSVMDAPGPFVGDADKPMGGGNFWRPGEPLDEKTYSDAIRKLAELSGKPAGSVALSSPLSRSAALQTLAGLAPNVRSFLRETVGTGSTPITRGDFALAAAHVLVQTGKPVLLSDAKAVAN